MKKYNRDKRGVYNAHDRNHTYIINEMRGTDNGPRIHINIRYGGYNKTEYIPIIYRKTRDNKAQTYVNITNAINDIFPEINTPHTAHLHRATAPYHKYIPQATHHTRPEPEPDTIKSDTRTVKCIIMSDDDDIIYIGRVRRTRTVNITQGTIEITLHRGERTMTAYERAISPDMAIHGITVREIKAHDVEIYYI